MTDQYWAYVDPKRPRARMKGEKKPGEKKRPPRRKQDFAMVDKLKQGNKFNIESFSDWQNKANKSAVRRDMYKTGGGGFGKPTVHQVIDRHYEDGTLNKRDPAHDLGSGKLDAVRYHNDQGRNWTGSDMGKNVTPEHDQGALKKKGKFKITSAANVLNVIHGKNDAESIKNLHGFVKQAAHITHPEGTFYVNHPKDPRYHGLGNKEVEGVLKSHFGGVKKDSVKKDVYICKEPKQ